MNRVDFMQQLESLLQSIAPMERDEALQYYNDYFDDAGKENEREVIEALGTPARVAENIKRDLLGSGYGEGGVRKARASDRALVEYGKEDAASENTAPENPAGETTGNSVSSTAQFSNSANTTNAFGNASNESTSYGNTIYDSSVMSWQAPADREGSAGKSSLPGWAIGLLAAALILASPVLLGIVTGAGGVVLGAAGTLAGIVIAWFAMIFAFGAAFIAMFVLMVVLVVIGFMCLFTNPWVGLAMIGSGLVCGGIGLLFLMLTVAMAGIATPAAFRGIGRLFRFLCGRVQKKPAKGVI